MRGRRRAGLLVVLALACGEKQQPPQPAGDGPAGVVLTVEGDVSAQRATAAVRKLAVKDAVFADDTVTAAAGASVRIELAHNLVVWTLDGGSAGLSRKVVESAAWNAPRRSGEAEALAAGDKDRTSAAGRHTEPEAAGTPASVPPAEASAKEEKDEPKTRAPAPRPPRTRSIEAPEVEPSKPAATAPARHAAPATAAPAQAAPPAPPPPPVAAPSPSPSAPPEPAPADTKPDGELLDAKSGGGGGFGNAFGSKRLPRSGPVVEAQVDDVGAGLDRDAALRVLRGVRGPIATCIAHEAKQPAGMISIEVVINTEGRVSQALAPAPDLPDALRGCVLVSARAWRFPAVASPVTLKARFVYATP